MSSPYGRSRETAPMQGPLSLQQVNLLKDVSVGRTYDFLRLKYHISSNPVVAQQFREIYSTLGVKPTHFLAIKEAVRRGYFSFSDLIPGYNVAQNANKLYPREIWMADKLKRGLQITEIEEEAGTAYTGIRAVSTRLKEKLGANNLTHAAVILSAAEEQNIDLQRRWDITLGTDALLLKAQGNKDQEIADQLGVSSTIAKDRIKMLQAELGAGSIFRAIESCLMQGLLTPEQITNGIKTNVLNNLTDLQLDLLRDSSMRDMTRDEIAQKHTNYEESDQRKSWAYEQFSRIFKKLGVKNEYQAGSLLLVRNYLRAEVGRKIDLIRSGKTGLLILDESGEILHFFAGSNEELAENWPYQQDTEHSLVDLLELKQEGEMKHRYRVREREYVTLVILKKSELRREFSPEIESVFDKLIDQT